MPLRCHGVVMRSARRATALAFFVTGAVFATFAARIPALQDRLGLSPGRLSLVFLALNAGAVAGLAAGGLLSSRLGSRAALRAGFALYPPALVAAGLAPSALLLCLAVAVMAAANSVVDVAMNVQGAEVERRLGRPVLSGLHAGHSLGVLAGATAGVAVASAGVPALPHFAVVAVLGTVGGLAATVPLLDTRDGEGERPRFSRATALLGLLAFFAFLGEGGANDWSAVHVRTVHHTGQGLAAGAFAAYSLALAGGRLLGDRVVARLGRARAVRAAAVVAAAGIATALGAPGTAGALAGWAVFGAGLSLLAPTIIGAAGGAPAAIAAVSACGYLGSFSGPPAIGGLAELVSLTLALTLLGVAVVTVALLARRALPA
jgi:MFS family permease